jgi:hypothetical protein
MTKSTKVTTTKTQGWQTKCLDWAVAGEYFEIHGVGARQLAFCKELCDTFNYECLYESEGKKSIAVFTPLSC